MIYLLDFSPIKPDFGMLFWTTLFFLLFWVLIGRMAFKPITNALKKREDDIQDALDEAKKAREEMSNLQSENQEILRQTQEERAEILKEAKAMKNNIINEAKGKAKEEAQKIVTEAREQIESQKTAAINEVKKESGKLALAIAEKIIKQQLANDDAQVKYAESLIDEIKLN